MKKGTVKYSKEFVTSIGTKEWIGIEMEYDMKSECPKDVLSNAKEIIMQWHTSNNQQPTQLGPPIELPVINKAEEREIGVTVESIMSCQDIPTLQTYYMLVNRLGRVDLIKAYDVRKSQLVEKESKEILEASRIVNKKQNNATY